MVVVAELGVRLGVGQFARERCVTVGIDGAKASNLAQDILLGGLDRERYLRVWRGMVSDWGIVLDAASQDSSLSSSVWTGAMSSGSCLKNIERPTEPDKSSLSKSSFPQK